MAPPHVGHTNKVFVGGLPQDCSTETIREYFEPYGNITDAIVMTDRDTGRSRGFGFVTFDNNDSVEAVMAKYSEHKVRDKWIEVKRAKPQGEAPPPVRGGGGGGGQSRGHSGGTDGGAGGGCSGTTPPPPPGYAGCYGAYGVPPAYGGCYGASPPGYYGGCYGAYGVPPAYGGYPYGAAYGYPYGCPGYDGQSYPPQAYGKASAAPSGPSASPQSSTPY